MPQQLNPNAQIFVFNFAFKCCYTEIGELILHTYISSITCQNYRGVKIILLNGWKSHFIISFLCVSANCLTKLTFEYHAVMYKTKRLKSIDVL